VLNQEGRRVAISSIPRREAKSMAANPYDDYVRQLDDSIYVGAPAAFEHRLWALFGLCIYALTTSVILIIIALLEASYRHGRRTLWLFKLVRRDNGRFIIGNASLLWPATVCAEFAVFLPYLLAMKSIYVDRSDPASAYYWRCLTTLPILFSGMLSTWISLQASLLAGDNAVLSRLFRSARIANVAFVACMVLSVVPVAVYATWYGSQFVALWALAKEIREQFVRYGQQWSGTFDPAAYGVVAQVQALSEDVQHLQRAAPALGVILLIIALVIFFLNLAALSMALLIRKQIRFNLERLGTTMFRPTTIRRVPPETPTLPFQGEQDTLEPSTQKNETPKTESTKQESSQQSSGSARVKPPRLQVRQLLNESDKLATHTEQATKIIALQRVQRNLVAAFSIIGFATLIYLGLIATFLATYLRITESWPLTELTTLGHVWVLAVPICLTNSFRIYNELSVWRDTRRIHQAASQGTSVIPRSPFPPPSPGFAPEPKPPPLAESFSSSDLEVSTSQPSSSSSSSSGRLSVSLSSHGEPEHVYT